MIIENIPLDRGKYSKLNFYLDTKNDFELKRIDYYDRDGVLLKSLKVTFSRIPVRKAKDKTINTMIASKLEMMHMGEGTISVLEYLINDQTAKLDASLFKKENIEK